MRRLPRTVGVHGGVVLVWLLAVVGTACSSDPELTADQRAEVEAILDRRTEMAMISLSEQDRTCTVDAVDPLSLAELRAADPVLEPLATAVVDCVGEELIGSSVLRPQAASVAPESLACAVGELDRAFVIELVEGAMAERPPRVRAEIAVARALGVCLELDELLAQ